MSENKSGFQNMPLSCDIVNILVNLHFQLKCSTCLITPTHGKFRKVAKRNPFS